MIARLILLLVLLLPGFTNAAESLAALQARLQTVSGRERVYVLNDVAKAYWGVSTDESLAYTDRAIASLGSSKFGAGLEFCLWGESGHFGVKSCPLQAYRPTFSK